MDHLRNQIDDVDQNILSLLSERANIALCIMNEKNKLNQDIYCQTREQDVLDRIQNSNKSKLDNEAVKRVFSTIIDECRNLQTHYCERHAI